MEELRISERPTLRRPVLVAAFRGWNDGGQGATLAAGHLASEWDATRFAEIDPEGFYDFQATRPHVSLVDGLSRRIEWPENEFFHAPMPGADGDLAPLVELLPDPASLSEEERLLLATDLDEALERLTPRHREVLIARFLEDESAAEIAKREGRSEQAISGWVRDALAEMRHHLQHWRHEPPREEAR